MLAARLDKIEQSEGPPERLPATTPVTASARIETPAFYRLFTKTSENWWHRRIARWAAGA
jgi:hypothetical protein